MRHHQRLADAVQHHSCDVRILIHDGAEQLEAHVDGWFEFLERPRTCSARQIAAVGGLEVEANRVAMRDVGALRVRSLEISARVDGLLAVAGLAHSRSGLSHPLCPSLWSQHCAMTKPIQNPVAPGLAQRDKTYSSSALSPKGTRPRSYGRQELPSRGILLSRNYVGLT